MDRDEVIGEQRILVRDGELAATGSWVYVWMADDDVFYVGATGLPPVIRSWLHLHDDAPEIGRVRAHHPGALHGSVEVRAFQLADDVDRQRVKQLLLAHLGLAADEEPGTDDEAAAATHILRRLDLTGRPARGV
jgi:hypothetical protein